MSTGGLILGSTIGGILSGIAPILTNQQNIQNQQFLTMLPLLMTANKEGDSTGMIIMLMMMNKGNNTFSPQASSTPITEVLNPGSTSTINEWTKGFIPLPTTNSTVIPFWGNPLWFIQKPYQMIKF